MATGYIEYTKQTRRKKRPIIEGTAAAAEVVTRVAYTETKADGSLITKHRYEALFKDPPKESQDEMQVDDGNDNQNYDIQNDILNNSRPPTPRPRKRWVCFSS